MATLNLGRIKPVFQGAYNNSTAYVVDDIVTFGDETFICIQASTGNATSNASYWTKLAAKGTDGTDVGTTLTTQGDILYRDGNGLQRLGAGTSGQFLKTQGSGANPVWGTVSSDYVKLASGNMNGGTNVQIDGYFSSTYDVYRLIFHSIQGDTDNQQLNFTVQSGGSEQTSSDYYYSMNRSYIQSGNTQANDTAVSEWAATRVRMDDGNEDNTHPAVLDMHIYNPLSTAVRKVILWSYWMFYSNGSQFNSIRGGLNWDNTTALSGIRLYYNSGNFESSTTTAKNAWTLYGLK